MQSLFTGKTRQEAAMAVNCGVVCVQAIAGKPAPQHGNPRDMGGQAL